MQNVEVIKEKNAVLVPLKKWESMQKEFERLKKKAAKFELLNELGKAIAELEADLQLPKTLRKRRKTADEFLSEMQDAK